MGGDGKGGAVEAIISRCDFKAEPVNLEGSWIRVCVCVLMCVCEVRPKDYFLVFFLISFHSLVFLEHGCHFHHIRRLTLILI